jgi:hypothetical protein
MSPPITAVTIKVCCRDRFTRATQTASKKIGRIGHESGQK